MSTMTDPGPKVTGGVDTHRDVHVVAALNQLGQILATASFPTSRTGYRALLGWLGTFGEVTQVGVEGTGAWGAGLTRFLTDAGIDVIEVGRPNRQRRRRYGKSDTTDAVSAARAVQSGEASGKPRGGSGPIESLRLLQIARRSAIKQRTVVANQIHAIVVTAPDQTRGELAGLSVVRIVTRAAGWRPGDPVSPTQAARITLKALAGRYQYLSKEIVELDTHITPLVDTTAPAGLLAMCGVGPQTAAALLIAAGTNPDRIGCEQSFAALCGTSPVDASSGRQVRHRLNRGGDRQANAALYRIVIVRLRYHQATRDYMTRRLAEGKTKKETIRCLKRYIATQVFHHLTQPAQTAKTAA